MGELQDIIGIEVTTEKSNTPGIEIVETDVEHGLKIGLLVYLVSESAVIGAIIEVNIIDPENRYSVFINGEVNCPWFTSQYWKHVSLLPHYQQEYVF